MSQNNENRRSSGHRKKSATGVGRQGTGQQTAGERGQKKDKKNEEHYRSSDQKTQKGNHGGNR